jgi:hypothetical protein
MLNAEHPSGSWLLLAHNAIRAYHGFSIPGLHRGHEGNHPAGLRAGFQVNHARFFFVRQPLGVSMN